MAAELSDQYDGEQIRRQERADRILDTAMELILRWGYKKTTIDDIAKQAGVAKGTIYLHWKTRDDLFRALIIREKVREGQRMQREMAADPEGFTLHGMCKYSLLSALRNPLMKALLQQDTAVIGAIVDKSYAEVDARPAIEAFHQFVIQQRDLGLIRTDLSLTEQIQVITAVLHGFLRNSDYLPDEYEVSIEQKVNLAAEVIRRTFEVRSMKEQEQSVLAASFRHVIDEMQIYQEHEYDEKGKK